MTSVTSELLVAAPAAGDTSSVGRRPACIDTKRDAFRPDWREAKQPSAAAQPACPARRAIRARRACRQAGAARALVAEAATFGRRNARAGAVMRVAARHLASARAAVTVGAEAYCARGSRSDHRTRTEHCCTDAGPLQQAPSRNSFVCDRHTRNLHRLDVRRISAHAPGIVDTANA